MFVNKKKVAFGKIKRKLHEEIFDRSFEDPAHTFVVFIFLVFVDYGMVR